MILSANYFLKTINSLEDNVRISKRVFVPSRRLRGFENGKIGPKDGSQYIGEFRNGKKHGMGKYSYPDGATYVGQYQNGLLHGQGKLTLPDGSVKKGLFKNDKFVRK